jgi:SAM-dependent methyltransferase
MSSTPSAARVTSSASPTPPEVSAEARRAEQCEQWSEAAALWTGFNPVSRPITDRLIQLARIGPGDKVVDLACGTGMPALVEAELVGPSGHVLGLDLVPEMIDVARVQGEARSLLNVEFRVISDEAALPLSEGEFDAATCKHGLMWMPNPPGAATALRRALRVGGRIAVSSWVPPRAHPLLSIVSDLMELHFGYIRPPDPRPPAEFASEKSLVALLLDAGYRDVASETVTVGWELAESADEYVEEEMADHEFLEAAKGASPELLEQLRVEAIGQVRSMAGGGSLLLDLQALVASGRKPA